MSKDRTAVQFGVLSFGGEHLARKIALEHMEKDKYEVIEPLSEEDEKSLTALGSPEEDPGDFASVVYTHGINCGKGCCRNTARPMSDDQTDLGAGKNSSYGKMVDHMKYGGRDR